MSIREQRRRWAASRRRVTASRGAWVLVLLGASACNSLLGIREASLDCDDPDCAAGDPRSIAPTGMQGPAASGVDRGDGGVGPNGAGRSNGASDAGTPASSGASSEAGPVAPLSPPAGGAGGGGPTSGSPGTSNGGSSGGAGAPPPGGGGAGTGGTPSGGLCNSGDACGDCLCESCDEPLADCTDTPGCLEILACARNSGCVGFACYCGSVDLFTCATSNLADGPCVATMLAAPGSHPPTVSEPNAGPASRAALVMADCRVQRCAAACGD